PLSSQGLLVGSSGHLVVSGAQLPRSTVKFVPKPLFTGTATFSYQARFGTLTSNVASVQITVSHTTQIKLSAISTISTKPRLLNNYVVGATVFLDANRNGVLDFLDSNGNGVQDAGEPSEPSAVTGPDAFASLDIPAAFDRNGDGVIDTNEGR